MINFNGEILSSETILDTNNRAFLYGDAVFETMKVVEGKVLFAEDHYFRLMASMRILRMEIPMDFTMEYFEEQVLFVAKACGYDASARARMTVFRNEGGNYLPSQRNVSFVVKAEPLENTDYVFLNSAYEVELYKDFYVSAQLLSTLKTTNRLVNITGSIFAQENGYDNCLLINEHKNVVEALQGNLFMLMGDKLITPPLSEGCLNGVMRKQILALAKKNDRIEVIESVISPFDLQKADELFLTNVIVGIQPITKYRKKQFGTQLSAELLEKLNESVKQIQS